MSSRREGEQNPFWKRMELVMRVHLGELGVTEAAAAMGITRMHFYRLEEEMLRAALEAVSPGKRGPQVALEDPNRLKREEEFQTLRREKELLELKVTHLEEIQKEMFKRGIGLLREKKRGRSRRKRVQRTPLHPGVQATGAGAVGGKGRGPGSLRRDGARPVDPVPLEGGGGAASKAGPQAPGGGP